MLAVVNLLAAAGTFTGAVGPLQPTWAWTFASLSGFAAFLAAILAVLANLENFANSAERSKSYSEARELFVDAAREFSQLWIKHSGPLLACS